MRPDKLSVADLFQRERRYTVPLYQRPYVWTREEQWEPLWDDIERQAEACLAIDSLVPKRTHFLGAIVLNVSKIVGSGVARSEVIDGQQRLTTLQITIAAMRDFAVEHGSEQAARLTRLTLNEDEKPGSEGAFKVWPTNADRDVFRAVQTAGSVSALLKVCGVGGIGQAPRMAAAYAYFSERVREFVAMAGADHEARERRLLGLLQALRVSLQLVVIELEDGDDPQIIFETLNARGQPLLPSDLIRNYVFLQATNDPASDADELYSRYWRNFDTEHARDAVNGETRFWHVTERQGRLTRPRIDLFLFHYLVMKTDSEIQIGQLFREFRDWRDTCPMPIEALLSDLATYASVFKRLVQPSGIDRVSVFAQRLRCLDTSTVYPLLLYIIALPNDRLSKSSREQIVGDIESWLIRRFVCGMTTKGYNQVFVRLLSKLKHADAEADLAEVVRAELLRSGDVTAAWPSDALFLSSWLTKPVYARSRTDRSATLLRAIELQKRTSKNEPNPVPEHLTVEHLLPQKGSLADYPFATDVELLPDESPQRGRDRLIHTIGNLTLLTGELNTAISNGPFPSKVTQIVEDSDLRLNAWLRADPPTTWSEASILKRGGELFATARQIWPRAEGEPENVEDADDFAETKPIWRFTSAELLREKRANLLKRLGQREGVQLEPVSASKAASAGDEVRAVVAVSKRYGDRNAYPYWYAYHPEWDEFLDAGARAFAVFGCVDREDAFAVPLSMMRTCLADLNTTVRAATGKLHWHVHLVERSEGLGLLLPKLQTVLALDAYRLGTSPPLAPPGKSLATSSASASS